MQTLEGLIASPTFPVAVLILLVCVVLIRSVWRPRRRWYPRDNVYRLGRPDSADQLRDVSSARFTAKRVMNRSEYRVFREVEAVVREAGGGRRLFAQTSLGEILSGSNERAHAAINSKRVDMLVIGPDGLPLLAVEYQGAGHFQGSAAARDAVKKEALRLAGVGYLEFSDSDSPDEIRRRVLRLLSPESPVAPVPTPFAGPWSRPA